MDKALPISLEDIIESLDEGVVAVGGDLKVASFNQSAEKLFELSRSLVLGRPADECFRRNPRVAEALRKALAGGSPYSEREERLARRLGGDTVPVSIAASQVLSPDGSPSGAVALIRDLSGIKPLEAGEQRKERLAYIGTFAANLAHEIKNPLSGIRGAAQLLSRRVKEPGLTDYTDVIMKEADRLNKILNDMLDLARPAKPASKAVNIHQVLDAVVLLMGQGSGASFVRGYDPSLPDVAGDEDQLKQVFLNLVKNSKEAIAEGGVISITTRAITDFHLVGGTAGGRMVSVEVRDNGSGIRPEDLEKIFTPFFTTKPRGSGLGMAITLKIVKEHGGLLKIDSVPGSGTSVAVYLPIFERRGR